MKRLHFTYDMKTTYTDIVSDYHFTMKCIPVHTPWQRVDNLQIHLSPACDYQWGADGFGNTYIWGKQTNQHTSFHLNMEGDVITDLSGYGDADDTALSMIYAHPYGLNRAGSCIRSFFEKQASHMPSDVDEKVIFFMNLLLKEMTYLPGSTTVNTTAEEAFSQRCGVCQDYAHILIALLHLSKIPARYVTGFMIGEGESHAWVEYLNHDKWVGIDPTNNRSVTDEYIKIANGRDAKDCLMNRGILRGGGPHTQTVHVLVREAEKGETI